MIGYRGRVFWQGKPAGDSTLGAPALAILCAQLAAAGLDKCPAVINP